MAPIMHAVNDLNQTFDPAVMSGSLQWPAICNAMYPDCDPVCLVWRQHSPFNVLILHFSSSCSMSAAKRLRLLLQCSPISAAMSLCHRETVQAFLAAPAV